MLVLACQETLKDRGVPLLDVVLSLPSELAVPSASVQCCTRYWYAGYNSDKVLKMWR